MTAPDRSSEGHRVGDVLTRGRRAYLVAKLAPGLVLVRLLAKVETHHRADVRLGWAEVGGVFADGAVVRCVSLPATGATGMKYLGRISPVALQRVLAALDRERCARLMEESPRIASNLMTSIASTGRKVGRMAGC
jgi:hypothetical protein